MKCTTSRRITHRYVTAWMRHHTARLMAANHSLVTSAVARNRRAIWSLVYLLAQLTVHLPATGARPMNPYRTIQTSMTFLSKRRRLVTEYGMSITCAPAVTSHTPRSQTSFQCISTLTRVFAGTLIEVVCSTVNSAS